MKTRKSVSDQTWMCTESERKRQEKANRDTKKNARGGPQAAKARQSKDVVGNPKGQGQDKQTLINRARKNTNKNKHQRAAADRKMAKGMF